MRTLLVVSVVVCMCIQLSSSSQYVPIPKKHPGILIGSPGAQVIVELVYDAQCDDSAALNAKINQVIKQLGNLTDSKISFRYYMFALPYHIYAMKFSQGFQYMRDVKGDAAAHSYIEYCLNNVEKWSEVNMLNTTMESFHNQVSSDVSNLLGVDKSAFFLSLLHGNKYDSLAREEYKHLSGSRGVSGTPRAFINGALVDGADEWTVDQWVNKLKALAS